MHARSRLKAVWRIVVGAALFACISCPADPPGEGFLDLIIIADRTGADDVEELRVRPVRIEAVLSDDPDGEQRTVTLTVDNPSLVLAFGLSTEAISLATLSVPIGFLHQLRLITEHVEVLGPVPVELPPCDGPSQGRPPQCEEPIATSDGAALARVPSGPHTGIKIVPEDGRPFPFQEGLTTKILVEFFVRDELRRPPGQGLLFGPTLDAKLVVAAERSDARPGELIIGFADDLSRAEWDDVLDSFDSRTRIRFVVRSSIGLIVARIPDDKSIEDALEHFAAREEIRYVLPNGIVRLTDNPRPAGAPDDPEADNQIAEYLDHIGVPRAWDRQIGSMDVIVALLDTGVSLTQPEIVPNLFLNEGEVPTGLALVDADIDGILTFRDLNDPANAGIVLDALGDGLVDGSDVLQPLADGGMADGVDGDGNGIDDDLVGASFLPPAADGGDTVVSRFTDDDATESDGLPVDGHGTATASTIGALGNNSLQLAGVNWNVRILPVKVFDSNGDAEIAIILEEALRYARSMGAHIAVLPLGGSAERPELNTPEREQKALDAAIKPYLDGLGTGAESMVIVISAGNEPVDCSSTTTLCVAELQMDHKISVAAILGPGAAPDNPDGIDVRFSLGATTIDLAAPGAGIISLGASGQLFRGSGTSQSTAFVGGAAALVASQFPALRTAPGDLRARILDTAVVVEGLEVIGGRRLDVGEAVNAP